MKLTINLTKADIDVLNSATQQNIKPSVSLMAVCGDIIIEAYKEKKKELDDLTYSQKLRDEEKEKPEGDYIDEAYDRMRDDKAEEQFNDLSEKEQMLSTLIDKFELSEI